jgi:hypothetical protein
MLLPVKGKDNRREGGSNVSAERIPCSLIMCVKGLADIHFELHKLALTAVARIEADLGTLLKIFYKKTNLPRKKFHTSQSPTSNNFLRSRWRVRLGDTFASTLGNIQSFISSSCSLFTFNLPFRTIQALITNSCFRFTFAATVYTI